MMRSGIFIVIFGVFILIYCLVCYYIGLRGWHYLFRYIMPAGRAVYWALFGVTALSYFAARVGGGSLPFGLRYGLTVIGAYWLAAMFYLLQIIVALDLLRLLNKWLGFIPAAIQEKILTAPAIGGVVFLAVLGLVVFGSINAKSPRVQQYDLEIAKTAGVLEELHIVAVSDIHLGEINHNGSLVKMVEMINVLQPDIVLLPGDIIDEDVGPFIKQNMTETFRRLNPRYGLYAAPGNHEYIGGSIEEAVSLLEQAGIKVLRDEYIKVNDSFYIIGRDDSSHPRFTNGAAPKDLDRILEGADRSLPLILLNHQPKQLAEAEREGIDLQLSGHTHRGQMFPNNLITSRIFEIDWGYLKKGDFQLIVSSGYGTWGPPIRVGNRPEIVDIRIRFKAPAALYY